MGVQLPVSTSRSSRRKLGHPYSRGHQSGPRSFSQNLGLTWFPSSDILGFQFTIPTLDPGTILTKRTILSVIATLFDPLGLLGAVITTAKVFMQQLWTIRDENGQPLDWDQAVPPTVGEAWINFHEQLPLLNQPRIERCVIIQDAVDIEIHCFSDASEKAYGACLYIRSKDAEGRVKVRLLASKSKVAPLKCQTIPRLELCGAVLGAELFQKVRDSIRIAAISYFWTDSTCVLRWIQAPPTTWTTFVANRTAIIQTITEGYRWSHVPGIQNPADLISRGVTPQDILGNDFWWQGPAWLQESSEQWPKSPEISPGEAEIEKRRTVIAGTAVSTVAEFNQEYFRKFSSYSDLVRRTAYWLRLMKLLRLPPSERKDLGFLSTFELREAESTLVRLVQREVFIEELKALSKGWVRVFECTMDPKLQPCHHKQPIRSTMAFQSASQHLPRWYSDVQLPAPNRTTNRPTILLKSITIIVITIINRRRSDKEGWTLVIREIKFAHEN
nr:uncharacterized protein LOC115266986 [Aedes albopictus]